MLAKEVIFSRLKKAYVRLLLQQVHNRKHDIKDSRLDCDVAMAYSLIKIYPWLNDSELIDWRDKVEDVCDCTLPCIGCDNQVESPEDYDPETMSWVSDAAICEDLEGKWVVHIDTAECEDNGITTTQLPPPVTNFPDITTTQLDDPNRCWGPFGIMYKLTAEGPNSIEAKYLDCQGVETTINFIKGQLYCLSYRIRANGVVFTATDPANQQYMTASKFSAGVIPC